MLIIKAKNNLSRENMKKQYQNFLEQMQLGLIFINDEYDITVVEPFHDWIPVDEGLPEENKTVIASTSHGVYPEARYTKENGWEWAYEAGADYWKELADVTAWMPLPEKYVKSAVLGCIGRNEDKLIPIDNIKQEIFNAIDHVPITLSRGNADKLLKADIQNIIDKHLKKLIWRKTNEKIERIGDEKITINHKVFI